MSTHSSAPRILLLPGWQDSGDGHWQTRWEVVHGDERVRQHDWLWPRRGDWMAQLEEAVLADERPVVLVAHSLGNHLVSSWTDHSRLVGRVQAALLVAPPDLERPQVPPQLFNWRPMRLPRLPFPALTVYSEDDPWCTPERARWLAAQWGVPSRSIGARGHVNHDSGLGDWPEGRAWLQALMTTGCAPVV